MFNVRNKLKEGVLKIFFPKSDTELVAHFIKEAVSFFKLTMKYNASVNTDDDIEKMQYTILRENHVIEKGMSMRTPRKGFGQHKVEALLERIKKYYDLYGTFDANFLLYPMSTIKGYIEYTENRGTEIPAIREKFESLSKEFNLGTLNSCAGVVETTSKAIQEKCNSDFKSLLFSRHSIRYFAKEEVTKPVIVKALELAQRTPSACNRQGWKSHVFRGTESVRLIKWQGGAYGFEDEMRHCILVTANLKAFLSYEVHQAYVDGGLYAMNLINAIHSLGLGCIPLSCGFYEDKLKELKEFGIPENEVPIVIIAFGKLQDNFHVAASTRKNIELTNTFHG